MKIRLAVAALIAGVATLSSTPAFAYPDPVIGNTGGSAADGKVGKGETFTLTGDFGGTDCQPWIGSFNGATQPGSGSDFSVTFTTPNEDVSLVLTISCAWEDGTTPSTAATTKGATVSGLAPVSDGTVTGSARLGSIVQNTVLSFPIQVGLGSDAGDGDADGSTDGGSSDGGSGSTDSGVDDSNGVLPDTGSGTGLWVLAGGVALAAAGGATIAARRRQA